MVENHGEDTAPEPSPTPSVLTASGQQKIDQIKQLFIPARPGKLSTTTLAEHKIELAEEWRNQPLRNMTDSHSFAYPLANPRCRPAT